MFCDIFKNFSPVPCSYYHIAPVSRTDTASYGLRKVQKYELELIEEGTGKIIIDGKEYPAADHMLHFRRPGMWAEGIGMYQSRWIEFDFNESQEVVDELNGMPAVYFLEENYAEVKGIFYTLFREYYDGNILNPLSYKILVMGLFKVMVHMWYQETEYTDISIAVVERIRKSITYIHEHLFEPITVNELAEVAGYSLYHYTRVFKNYTAQTPIQYISRLRINHAKMLLVETYEPIGEIAVRCGFDSYSYFSRIFKKKCDMAPYQYRKKHRKIFLKKKPPVSKK